MKGGAKDVHVYNLTAVGCQQMCINDILQITEKRLQASTVTVHQEQKMTISQCHIAHHVIIRYVSNNIKHNNYRIITTQLSHYYEGYCNYIRHKYYRIITTWLPHYCKGYCKSYQA